MLGNGTSPKCCLKCIGKMTIECGRCGKLIFIGDRATKTLVETSRSFVSGVETVPRRQIEIVGCARGPCVYPYDQVAVWIPGANNKGDVSWTEDPYQVFRVSPVAPNNIRLRLREKLGLS